MYIYYARATKAAAMRWCFMSITMRKELRWRCACVLGSWRSGRCESGQIGSACCGACSTGSRCGRCRWGRTQYGEHGEESVGFFVPQLRAVCGPGEGQRWQQQGENVHQERRIGVGERNASKTNSTISYCIWHKCSQGPKSERGKYGECLCTTIYHSYPNKTKTIQWRFTPAKSHILFDYRN